MTAAELLQPRFEVIADYPSSSYELGFVLTASHHHVNRENIPDWAAYYEQYPHIFRKMNWWECRTVEQMPRKVMSIADDKGTTFEIEKWDMKNFIGYINKEEGKGICLYKPKFGYIPVD